MKVKVITKDKEIKIIDLKDYLDVFVYKDIWG